MTYTSLISDLFSQLHIERPSEGTSSLRTPIDGTITAKITPISADHATMVINRAHARFLNWRDIPAPSRAGVLRVFGEKVRLHKNALARLISIEVGKISAEALGEVQEVIDICEFAVGLSRQLYGLTIASERVDHKLHETWHPLGVVGVISAFNFPMAVWAWNAALALVCGNTVVWKPSEKALLSAIAINGLLIQSARDVGIEAEGLSEVLLGTKDIGELLVGHERTRLISATGSTQMGRRVNQICSLYFKRALLELGGNNAAIVAPSADLELARRAVVFAAAGTSGQRCTTLRRLFVHRTIHAAFLEKLKTTYCMLPIGNPLTTETLIGPLIDDNAYRRMQVSLEAARSNGGRVHFGDRVMVAGSDSFYVRPAIVEMTQQVGPMLEETFAPILYVLPYSNLEEAIAYNNSVRHGLSSAIFTRDLQEAEIFTSSRGSDCGIANVNIGTSGAEIGGAFGGEKETGGGRESGSDAWKNYMRRATNTVNYGNELPLSQNISFDI